jgi:hypothetical protein
VRRLFLVELLCVTGRRMGAASAGVSFVVVPDDVNENFRKS